VRNQKTGILFYSVSGMASIPYQAGLLCVSPQIKRTPPVNSGGNPTPMFQDCTGDYSIDFNGFIASGNGIPALHVVGTVVDCQWWGRDTGFLAPNNTSLSNALHFVIGP
jgi:hypothetical protein